MISSSNVTRNNGSFFLFGFLEVSQRLKALSFVQRHFVRSKTALENRRTDYLTYNARDRETAPRVEAKPKAKKQRTAGSNRCVCHTDMGEVQMEGPAKEKEQGRQTVPQKIRAQMLRV